MFFVEKKYIKFFIFSFTLGPSYKKDDIDLSEKLQSINWGSDEMKNLKSVC